MVRVKNKLFVFFSCVFLFLCNGIASSSSVGERISISPFMKAHIMQSPFKMQLQRNDGKKMVAYLYAEDERSEPIDSYSCITGDQLTGINKIGHYYIYLYDVNNGAFLHNRTKIFSKFREIRLNGEGAMLTVLSNHNSGKSDVLLISQFGDCNGDFFEAFGFSENQQYLEKYSFVGKRKEYSFYGRISNNKTGNKIAYEIYDDTNSKMQKLKLDLSNKPSEIQLQPIG